MKTFLRLRARWVVVAALLALAAAGGIAYASIPDSGGVIHGCYQNKNGNLRVVDTDAGKTCDAKKETALSWNQGGGLSTVDALQGVACVNHTYPGTIAVSYALDGTVTMTCVLANNAGLSSLAAAAKIGDANLKVTTVDGMTVGQQLVVDPGGAAPETFTIVSVGTTGALGTGVDLSGALAQPHPNGTVVGFQDA